jgi:hypothetical protein
MANAPMPEQVLPSNSDPTDAAFLKVEFSSLKIGKVSGEAQLPGRHTDKFVDLMVRLAGSVGIALTPAITVKASGIRLNVWSVVAVVIIQLITIAYIVVGAWKFRSGRHSPR